MSGKPSSKATMEATTSSPETCEISKHSTRLGILDSPNLSRNSLSIFSRRRASSLRSDSACTALRTAISTRRFFSPRNGTSTDTFLPRRDERTVAKVSRPSTSRGSSTSVGT